MSPVSYLYIVASRHPRVGKTLIARLLLDFLRLAGRPLVGYDLDPREPSFAACYPNLVWPVTSPTRAAKWRCSTACSPTTGARR
jgi:hypothetical protein